MERITDRLLSWASILEDEVRARAVAASRMPFVLPHVALVPDAHLGRGATAGSVIPTLRSLVPAAAGVDTGCGTNAVLTPLVADDLGSLGSLSPLREAVAAELCERWWIDLPHRDLACLLEGTDECWAHVRELRRAQEFARLNRAEVVDRTLLALADSTGRADVVTDRLEEVSCHHGRTETTRRPHGAGGARQQAGLALPQGGHLRAEGRAGPHPGVDG